MASVTQDDCNAQLQTAARFRPVIGQANGVLVRIRRATPEQAFTELVHVSRKHNVNLGALAEALVTIVDGDRYTAAELAAVVHLEWGGLLPNR